MIPFVDLMGRARRQYSTEGFGSLISKGTRFAARDFWLEMLIRRRYMSRSELEEFAKREGDIWYGNEEKPFRIPPVANPTLREKFGPYPKKYSPQKPFVCELRDCYLLGHYGLGFTGGGKIISETTPHSPKRLATGVTHSFNSPKGYLHLVKLREQATTRQIEDRVFSLINNDRGYYHWMLEYLPKIRLLEHYIKETGHEPRVIVNSNPDKFVRETLEAVGYGPDKYEEWEGGMVQVDRLIIPSHRAHVFDHYNPGQSDYHLSRDDLVWLRNNIRSNVNKNKNGKKIYISRQKTGNRRVYNYDGVMEIISHFGFEPYILEDLSFEEQVELFTEADVIMGPHGAGLSNMIFADDPLIIEMLPEDTLRPHFYFISGAMGFDYEPIVTEARNSELMVDVDELRIHLESLDL